MAKLITDGSGYSDLINNFNTFHAHYSEDELLDIKGKWEDDSDYSSYRTLEDLVENATPEDYETSHVVSVWIPHINSSEESLGGGDRPLWSITNSSAQKTQFSCLNREGKYRQSAAGVLSGMLRPHQTLLDHWVLSKFIGNNRVVKKLLANGGRPSRVLMQVQFHEVGKTAEEYIQIESELHSTDAGDRSGQNEKQKFMSGFRANREHEVFAFDFLKKYEYNYGTVMQQEGIEGSENWLTLKSLQGIKNGQGNGLFKTYGEENVGRALQTIKRLCNEVTKETVIGATPVEAIALMYHVYTENGKRAENSAPLFTHMELEDFFIKYFTHKNQSSDMFDNDKLMVNDLSWSGGVKDIAYICGKQFWPLIVEYWKKIKEKQIGFSIESHANLRLVDLCKDKNLKRELKAILA